MARRSGRLSAGGITGGVHKRAGSSTIVSSHTQPKRAKSNATSAKSQYFEQPSGEDDVSDFDEDSPSPDDEASEFGEDDKISENSGDSDSDEGDVSEAESKTRKSSKAGSKKDPELWRPGVKTGLGHGTQVIIKKIKARPAGDTPYSDDTIHPNTLLFLNDLKANNDRQWLKMHDAEFRQAEKDFYSFLEGLTEKLTEIDDTIPELPVKDIIFRIYRDVRFSKDPTPYKAHFSAAWSRTGRKGGYAAYYLQVAPNDSFIGCGLYGAEAGAVASMRREFERRPERIKAILMDDKVRKLFLENAPKKESSVVKAFAKSNGKNALKTRPKGYTADHAEIELLKLRTYTLGTKIPNEQILGSGGMDFVRELMTCMKTFVTYLNSVVMPDDQDSDGSDEEDDDEDEAGTEGEGGDDDDDDDGDDRNSE